MAKVIGRTCQEIASLRVEIKDDDPETLMVPKRSSCTATCGVCGDPRHAPGAAARNYR